MGDSKILSNVLNLCKKRQRKRNKRIKLLQVNLLRYKSFEVGSDDGMSIIDNRFDYHDGNAVRNQVQQHDRYPNANCEINTPRDAKNRVPLER